MMKCRVLTIGVLASHAGTTAQAVIDACADDRINGRVAVVISNNADADVLRRAADHAIAARHLSRATCPDPTELDETIMRTLREAGSDVVLLAGYLRKVGPRTLAAFNQRMINVHPALLPRHGGPGMYGRAVHQAVLLAGDPVTGASVHLVTANYDEGPVLTQREVRVAPDDTVDTLDAKVRIAEQSLLIDTLRSISQGDLLLPQRPWPEPREVPADGADPDLRQRVGAG
jgi:phosphoribosylglycinamide formyltransferase 1